MNRVCTLFMDTSICNILPASLYFSQGQMNTCLPVNSNAGGSQFWETEEVRNGILNRQYKVRGGILDSQLGAREYRTS